MNIYTNQSYLYDNHAPYMNWELVFNKIIFNFYWDVLLIFWINIELVYCSLGNIFVSWTIKPSYVLSLSMYIIFFYKDCRFLNVRIWINTHEKNSINRVIVDNSTSMKIFKWWYLNVRNIKKNSLNKVYTFSILIIHYCYLQNYFVHYDEAVFALADLTSRKCYHLEMSIAFKGMWTSNQRPYHRSGHLLRY